MPQDNFVYDHILIRYGELSTKGKNRKDFIKKLFNNVKNALSGFPALDYEKTHDRMYIHLNGEDPFQVKTYLEKVFGISSFSFAVRCDSDIEAIKATTLALAEQDEQRTFKVAARRSWKQFPMISDEINRAVAGNILRNTAWKVNVKTPDVKIQIEVHEQDTYIMTDKYPGAGGYPVGVGGKAMVMLSGGIDSPIASYLTMKRGVAIECVHYASPPYTSSPIPTPPNWQRKRCWSWPGCWRLIRDTSWCISSHSPICSWPSMITATKAMRSRSCAA